MTDGHLTDEQLSSHLDGIHAAHTDETFAPVAPDVGRHLSGCDPCRRRLVALETVRGRLRTPVSPVSPEVRAASIETVLARFGENQPDVGSGVTGTDAAGGSDVRVRPGGRDAPIPIPRRRPQVLVGAAAAVLVLAAAVGVPLALAGHTASESAQSTSAAKAPNPPSGEEHSARASGAAGLPGSATATIYDFGKVSSVSALRSRVTALRTNEFSAQATTKSPNQSASSVAPKANSTATASGSFGTPGQFEHCLSSAMRAAGSARVANLVATATLKGSPTLVYVFQPDTSGSPTGNSARTAVVATALDGCKVIATTHL
jgi:hypothetical protein